MCSSHKHHKVCMVGSCATGRCILVHSVVGGFWLVGFPQHYWEGLVVDRLLVVGYYLGCRAGCFKLALIDCWGQASWDDFFV